MYALKFSLPFADVVAAIVAKVPDMPADLAESLKADLSDYGASAFACVDENREPTEEERERTVRGRDSLQARLHGGDMSQWHDVLCPECQRLGGVLSEVTDWNRTERASDAPAPETDSDEIMRMLAQAGFGMVNL